MSDTLAEKKIAAIPNLKDNFPVWILALQSALRSGRVWDKIFALHPTTQLPPQCPDASTDPKNYMDYMEKALKACGWIDDAGGYEHLALTERFRQRADAYGMLNAIKEKYAKKTAVNRHQALVKLLNVAKKSEESCSEFTTRITQLQSHVRLLRLTGYSLDDLDDDICTQRLLANLDHSSEYYSTALSLTPLNFETVSNSMNERDENHSGSVPFANEAPISSANAASETANIATQHELCKLCEKQGHFVISCPRLFEARDWLRTSDLAHKNPSTNNNNNRGNNGWNGGGWRGESNSKWRGGGRGNGRGGGRRGNHGGGNGRGGWNNNNDSNHYTTRANVVEFEYAGSASSTLSLSLSLSMLHPLTSGQ